MAMHHVAQFADLKEDRPTPVTIGDTQLVLIRIADQIRAYQGECPHAGAPLADGAICSGSLICPWHKAAFAIDDGGLREPPALDSLQRYPASVEGGRVVVDDQPLSISRPAALPDRRYFVIVGGGAAGTAAASALREQGFTGRLALIDPQEEPGYDRTALSKFVIAGDMQPNEVPALRDESFYLDENIQRIQAAVTRLDAQNKQITLNTGERIDYDAALIATGGIPKELTLPGADLPQVLTLRSRDDAAAVLDAAQPDANAVIIGDSFIGLEAASALRKRGLAVTVLARHETPFLAQFGERIGTAIRRLHEQNGVLFRTHVEAMRFTGEHALEYVVLDSSERLPADLVLVGTGVRPATDFVQGLKRHEDGSLIADSGMQVCDSLWAAGDMTTFPVAGSTVRSEHWRLAQQQARIAAHNMLGGHVQFADVPFFWTFHFGKRIDYLGRAEQWDNIVYLGEPERFEFIALICKDGLVAAAVACQYERPMALLAERMKQPLGVDEALDLIKKAE
ncbi:pyridine nucleotide-disulfide oxidoreductase [Pseudomonas sp. S25]|uniref:Pyridine nucleotide-disulfide oxidoreductase n=1 Tax=Pseudomonas maioricensis TaxID=1766623 RepID=A0ABS9ZNY1_9PSED|nr:FAD-dependent oxidoreductase [Pseudomonas sp. S25]MCI8212284.1 pyridine nucleotide-disulfide oxidoreductase [Pseudomonas sp. S25]